jgi:lipase ATG15
MLPRSLLAALLLYIPPSLAALGEVTFSSQLQPGLQVPLEDQEPTFEFAPSQSYPLSAFPSKVKTRPVTVYRPRSLDVLHNARLRSLQRQESAVEQPIWDPVEVEGPDVEDLHTLAQLARMSGNAYALPGQHNWYDVDQAWNRVCIYDIPRSRSGC